MNTEKVTNLLFEAIKEFNSENSYNLNQSLDTVLFGENSPLDSLGLVNFIVAVEERIEDDLDISLTLADEKAMSERNSPFRTVQAFRDYILKLIVEANNE